VDFSVANGRAGLATLLARAPGFTAVIGGNDPLAIGALFECRDRGIEVPRDMSIAGFDDIELAGELSPGLTTVRVPSAEIGREAGRRLLARLAGKPVPVLKEMPAPLIVRGTTGPPPKR
jgi:LacI family transcriptional regulator